MNANANPPTAAATRLGRAVRATTEMAGVIQVGHRDSNSHTQWLRDVWLATMMDEELHLQRVEATDILRTAIVITVATLIGHLIPLIPFVALPRTPALVLAIVLSGLVLFGVGVYSARTLVGDWRTSGLKMTAIGLGAAATGFLVGRVLNTAGA